MGRHVLYLEKSIYTTFDTNSNIVETSEILMLNGTL